MSEVWNKIYIKKGEGITHARKKRMDIQYSNPKHPSKTNKLDKKNQG